MLRRNVRQRKEYLFKKGLEDREAVTFEKKKRLQDAIENDKAIPTELKGPEEKRLRKDLDLSDERTAEQRKVEQDNEYAYMGAEDPRIMITTSRDPSSRLMQFLKELRILFPNAQRVNRGGYVIKDLIEVGRKNDITDIILVHEHRGEPDGLIVSHLPYGPTAYFGLRDVVLRHDLSTKPCTMSERNPNLVFYNFETKIGKRVKNILQALYPPPATTETDKKRVQTFANYRDSIHFRHHNYQYKENTDETKAENVEITEVGPRFTMQLYRVELGTLDMKNVKTEWVLRPHFNKQKDALGEGITAEAQALGPVGA